MDSASETDKYLQQCANQVVLIQELMMKIDRLTELVRIAWRHPDMNETEPGFQSILCPVCRVRLATDFHRDDCDLWLILNKQGK